MFFGKRTTTAAAVGAALAASTGATASANPAPPVHSPNVKRFTAANCQTLPGGLVVTVLQRFEPDSIGIRDTNVYRTDLVIIDDQKSHVAQEEVFIQARNNPITVVSEAMQTESIDPTGLSWATGGSYSSTHGIHKTLRAGKSGLFADPEPVNAAAYTPGTRVTASVRVRGAVPGRDYKIDTTAVALLGEPCRTELLPDYVKPTKTGFRDVIKDLRSQALAKPDSTLFFSYAGARILQAKWADSKTTNTNGISRDAVRYLNEAAALLNNLSGTAVATRLHVLAGNYAEGFADISEVDQIPEALDAIHSAELLGIGSDSLPVAGPEGIGVDISR